MIRFTCENIEQEIFWGEERHINELVIENEIFYRNIVKSLNSSDANGICRFIYDSSKSESRVLSMTNEADIIYNPYNLEFNERRITTTLLKLLATTSTSENFYLSTNKIKTRIIKYVNELINSENFGFEVATDEFTLDQIAKAINLHIVDDEDDYIELLSDYMEVMTELTKNKIFVLVNFRSFINEVELLRLIKNVNNHEFNIFLLENKTRNNIDIPRVTIDNDLCEL